MRFEKKKEPIKLGKFKKYSFYFIIILFFFILGIWTEKYNFVAKPKMIIQEISQKVYEKIVLEYFDDNRLIIDINYKNFQKIEKAREIGLKNERLKDEDSKWANAKLKYDDDEYKVKIRLKGTHGDHWRHPYKWSFKIKLSNDKTIFNLKRFSIQSPQTTSFLHEWLFMKALKKEGLIHHRVKFVNVIINGNKLGYYMLIEQASKNLIEFNKRREGPIITFNKDLWIDEFNAKKNQLGINTELDNFWRSKITPVQFKNKNLNTNQEKYLNKAIFLLESFRNKELKPNEVFDVSQLAKFMALKAIFGSIELDTNDLKFYFNPVTRLLEPVGKEVHTNHKKFQHYSGWVFNLEKIVLPWQKHFLKILYDDKDFYELFLKELSNLSSQNYIQDIINENINEFNRYKKILKINHPFKEIINLEDINNTKEFIKGSLDPVQKVNVNLISSENNNLKLNIKNTQVLPVEIMGLKKDDKQIYFDRPIFVKGLELNSSNDKKHINIDCKNITCSRKNIKNLEIFYNILGQKKLYSSKIDFWSNSNQFQSFQSKNSLKTLKNLKIIEIQDDKINLRSDEWIIDQKIIIPKNYRFIVSKNTRIIFKDNGQLISHSPISFNGSKKEPIFVSSNFKDEINRKRNEADNYSGHGSGILVLNTKKKSNIDNVIFNKMSSPPLQDGEGSLGAINFYQSDVDITGSKFLNNIRGDDYINIIRSNFLIDDCYFENTNSDSIDLDFSNGIIKNSVFNKSINDAIDFSGSKVNLINVQIDKAGDKGISIGEESQIVANDISITNSFIGIASKDNSLATLDKIVINNVEIGLAAYTKKNEYGPAKININDLSISNSKKDFVSAIGSEIYFNEKLIKNTNCNKDLSNCPFLSD